MTALPPLPAAVVERVARFRIRRFSEERGNPDPWPMMTRKVQQRAIEEEHAALAEFLAIIEERAGKGWQIYCETHPARPWQGGGTIGLAELLEDSDDRS